ncbi:hypothetical protein GCM10007856_20110 [Azospirillum oryzae]|nr:hypothetical protein GCM10007856_20110 [Azospirillum oryzae]
MAGTFQQGAGGKAGDRLVLRQQDVQGGCSARPVRRHAGPLSLVDMVAQSTRFRIVAHRLQRRAFNMKRTTL